VSEGWEASQGQAARRGTRVPIVAILWLAGAATTLAAQPLPHPFDLSTLDGTTGVRFEGINVQDYSGVSVSGAGDVNGDGFEDLLIGASHADPDGHVEAGETYLIYGSASCIGALGVLDLATLDGKNGVRIEGVSNADHSGTSVSGAGDVNGDGYADLLIGAPGGPRGGAYLIFGSPMGLGTGATFDLSSLDGASGVQITGTSLGYETGHSVSGSGDVNGDGFSDLLLGTPRADPGGREDAGETYVVFGSGSGIGSAGMLDLSLLDGTNGASIEGIETDDSSGYSVSGAGDVDGDGVQDLILGAPPAERIWTTSVGDAYLVYGSATGIGTGGLLNLAVLNGTNGARIRGINPGDLAIWSVAGIGDFNGDGFADILGSAPQGYSAEIAGEAYLVYGSDSGVGSAGTLDLFNLDGANGVRLDVISLQTSWLGFSVSGAGDVNGDGFADLLIGHPFGALGGETYLVYGSGSEVGSAGVFDLLSLDGTNGIRIDRVDPSDWSGASVSSAGDVNADGLTDVLIGASHGAPGGDSEAGESYLIFGSGSSKAAAYQTAVHPGDAARAGIGMLGDGSQSIPLSRVWVDFDAGDDGSGGPASTEVIFTHTVTTDFSPLAVTPDFEWEISTTRVGYGSASVTFKGMGVAGETNWQGLLLTTDDGGATWYAPGSQVVDSVLHEITLGGQVFPRRYALMTAPDSGAPTVIEAVVRDDNDSGTADPGETLTLIFDRSVVVRPGLLSQGSFALPVASDSLGGAGFAVASNAQNSRFVDITLGAGAALTVRGAFSAGSLSAGSPSGIDLAAGLPPTAIQSLVGRPAAPSAVRDLVFAVAANSAVVDSAGGTVSVLSSPDAAYSRHGISLPAGALGTPTTITLQPPVQAGGRLNAIQIVSSTPGVTFSVPATLTLEFRDSDVDAELGQIEQGMRVHQLVENPPGTFTYVTVAGAQTVDVDANTVSVGVTSLNPEGSPGLVGVFATLPAETIERATHHIRAGGSGTAVVRASAPLPVGASGLYTLHQIEVPGYEVTTDTDPARIDLTLAPATIFDRTSTAGGHSFPLTSHSLFSVTTTNATGEPVAFTDPVNVTVEYLDGSAGDIDDRSSLFGLPAPSRPMRVVRDGIDGPQVDFRFVEGLTQTTSPAPGGGTVTALGVTNLTGPSGRGTWGAAAYVPATLTTGVEEWSLYW
jgi:hypothetical protein